MRNTQLWTALVFYVEEGKYPTSGHLSNPVPPKGGGVGRQKLRLVKVTAQRHRLTKRLRPNHRKSINKIVKSLSRRTKKNKKRIQIANTRNKKRVYDYRFHGH